MGITRLNLQNLELVRKEEDIPGNFISVRGEYFISEIGKTAFYKENGCMDDAHNDEDLRELFASQLLNEIDIPHADIILAYNENRHGCLSINILKENEAFVEQISSSYNPVYSVRDYIEKDISKISVLPNMTPEVIESRKVYLVKLLYYSAVLSNTDISSNNSQLIYNKETGEYRNPEVYDMGLSFTSDSDRTFFQDKGPNEVLKELYSDYATIISPIAVKVEKQLTPEKINGLISASIYDDFDPQVKKQIVSDLNDRINLVKKHNSKTLKIQISSIAEKVKGVNIQLKDKVSSLISGLKNVLGREDSK